MASQTLGKVRITRNGEDFGGVLGFCDTANIRTPFLSIDGGELPVMSHFRLIKRRWGDIIIPKEFQNLAGFIALLHENGVDLAN